MSTIMSIVLVCPFGSTENVNRLNKRLAQRYPYAALKDVTACAGGREPENEIYACGVRNFVEPDEFAALFMSLDWTWSESAILTLADSDNQYSSVHVWRPQESAGIPVGGK